MKVLSTISRYQKVRLQKLGATVTDTMVTATEDQLWLARIVGKLRVLLSERGLLTVN